MAKTQALRRELEKLGYGVQWQGAGQPIRVTKEGQTWDIPAAEYEVKGDTAYVAPETLSRITASPFKSGVQEQGLVHVRPYFEQKGYDVGWEPESRRVSITHPVTGETRYAEPETLEEGKAYFKPATLTAIEERLTPAYEKTYRELTAESENFLNQLRDYSRQYINTINDYMRQYSDQAVAMLAAYQQQYSQALDRLAKLTEPQTEVPESVKVAFKILQEQTEENIRHLRNELYKRGMLQSGYAGELEARLRKGMLTEQEKILADWLDQQHKQMFSAAMETARMYAQFAGGYAQMYEKAYMEPLRRYMDYVGQVYGVQSELAQKAYDLASKLKTWRAEQEEAARKARRTAEEAARKYELDLYKAMVEAEKAAALDEYRWKQLESLDAYRRAMAELRAAEEERRSFGNPAAEEAFIADLMEQPSFEAAMGYIVQNKDDILSSGARVSVLLDAINKRWPETLRYLEAMK